MYDLKFDFLKGQELGMLCFGPYTLTLHFDAGTQIQIEGEFWHVHSGKNKKLTKYHFPISTSHLTRLLMQKVEAVETESSGKLTLYFSNSDLLVIEGRVGPYEAYNLQHHGQYFVV